MQPCATLLRAFCIAGGLACLAGGPGMAEPGPPITLDFEETLGRAEVSDFYASYGINFLSAYPAAYPQISNGPSPFTLARFNPSDTMTLSSGLPVGGKVTFYLSTMTNMAIQLYSDTEGRGTPLANFGYFANSNIGCEKDPGFCNFQLLDFVAPAPFRPLVFMSLENDSSLWAAIDNITIVPIISSPSPVPEPAAWASLLAGVVALAGIRLRGWLKTGQGRGEWPSVPR